MTQCQSQFPILSVVDRLPQYSSDWRGRISGHTVGRVTQSTKKSTLLARCLHYLHLEWASTYWSCLCHKSRLSPISRAQSWIWPVSLIYCDHIVICKTSYFSKMFQICLWSMLRGIRSLEGWPTGPVYILLEPWNSSVPAASLQGKHACSGRKNTWSGLFYNCDNLVICMTANLSFFLHLSEP